MVAILVIIMMLVLFAVYNLSKPEVEIPYFEREKHERLTPQGPNYR